MPADKLISFWGRYNRLLKLLTDGRALDDLKAGLTQLETDIKDAKEKAPVYAFTLFCGLGSLYFANPTWARC